MGKLGDLKKQMSDDYIILKEQSKDKGGRPSFKNNVDEVFKDRKVSVCERQLKRLAMLKIDSDLEGLDHAIYIALDKLFKEYDV